MKEKKKKKVAKRQLKWLRIRRMAIKLQFFLSPPLYLSPSLFIYIFPIVCLRSPNMCSSRYSVRAIFFLAVNIVMAKKANNENVVVSTQNPIWQIQDKWRWCVCVFAAISRCLAPVQATHCSYGLWNVIRARGAGWGEVTRFDTISIWRHTSSMRWHVPMANLNAIRIFYVIWHFALKKSSWALTAAWRGVSVALARSNLVEVRHIFGRRQLVERQCRQCTTTSINDHRLVGAPIFSVECKRIVSVASWTLQSRRTFFFFIHLISLSLSLWMTLREFAAFTLFWNGNYWQSR